MNTIQAAHNIIKQLQQYSYSDAKFDQPSIIEDDGCLRIVWESGAPIDWASNDNYSQHVDVAAMCELMEMPVPKYEYTPYYIDPVGFCTEAYDSCSICLYQM